MDMHVVHPCIFSWYAQGKLYLYVYFYYLLLCLSLILKIKHFILKHFQAFPRGRQSNLYRVRQKYLMIW